MHFSCLTCDEIIPSFQCQSKCYLPQKTFLIACSPFCFPTILFFVPLMWSSIKRSCLHVNPSHCFINFRSPQALPFHCCGHLSSLDLLSLFSTPILRPHGLNGVHTDCLFFKLIVISLDKCDITSESLHLNSFQFK